MRVYVLELRGPAALTRAFDRVMESRHVASCLVEPESGRIRFLGWCSRHDLRPLSDAPEASHPFHQAC
jgi:hypothetical protein